MNIYDEHRNEIGEVSFQMGRAVIIWKDEDTKREVSLPNEIFEGVKRLGNDSQGTEKMEKGVDEATHVQLLKDKGELQERLMDAKETIKRLAQQRDVRESMIRGILDRE